MSLVASLRKVLKDAVCEKHEDDGAFTLREKRSGMRIRVSGPTGEAVVIGLDQRIGELGGLMPGPWLRTCDYLIIRQMGSKSFALFVELKLTWDEADGRGLDQLWRSLRFLEYLRSLCNRESKSTSDALEVRYALIAAKGNRLLDKQRIRSDAPPERIRYENIEVSVHVVGESIPFGSLWGS